MVERREDQNTANDVEQPLPYSPRPHAMRPCHRKMLAHFYEVESLACEESEACDDQLCKDWQAAFEHLKDVELDESRRARIADFTARWIYGRRHEGLPVTDALIQAEAEQHHQNYDTLKRFSTKTRHHPYNLHLYSYDDNGACNDQRAIYWHTAWQYLIRTLPNEDEDELSEVAHISARHLYSQFQGKEVRASWIRKRAWLDWKSYLAERYKRGERPLDILR